MALSLRLAANRLQSSGGGAASGNSSGEVAAEAKAALWSLRVRYLTVFLLMKFADWLQGSYFYEVYAAKNDSRTGEAFTPSAISSLFLVGFCSAMVCGAFAGSWADKFGRCVWGHSGEHLMMVVVEVVGWTSAGLAGTVVSWAQLWHNASVMDAETRHWYPSPHALTYLCVWMWMWWMHSGGGGGGGGAG